MIMNTLPRLRDVLMWLSFMAAYYLNVFHHEEFGDKFGFDIIDFFVVTGIVLLCTKIYK